MPWIGTQNDRSWRQAHVKSDLYEIGYSYWWKPNVKNFWMTTMMTVKFAILNTSSPPNRAGAAAAVQNTAQTVGALLL